MSGPVTLGQLIHSKTALERGIDNTPTVDILEKLNFTLAGIERVRFTLGFDLYINSGYRCYALNQAVGGAANSQHMKGEAVDFTCPEFGNPMSVASFLSHWTSVLGIDQLILEHTWVHASFTLSPRKQVLTYKDGLYLPGIT